MGGRASSPVTNLRKKSPGPKARLCGAGALARVAMATIYSAAMGSTITYLPN
jgi:hypothetical protein